ncbi:hypothetical protein THAOC_21546 [Thalassiosira oceanica]|uniref:Uncharacterized protein n=1 Tax=Thalassiosira oceanica TaxID=159749 RepID=K0RX44_THAOC|nr:hypothetical protein THAOC_21546 [Thalassiosira oceanica]|eukprot:EJK58343.1 hypothetical protein THAOC_21546 [Thalassiosira oceanica]
MMPSPSGPSGRSRIFHVGNRPLAAPSAASQPGGSSRASRGNMNCFVPYRRTMATNLDKNRRPGQFPELFPEHVESVADKTDPDGSKEHGDSRTIREAVIEDKEKFCGRILETLRSQTRASSRYRRRRRRNNSKEL